MTDSSCHAPPAIRFDDEPRRLTCCRESELRCGCGCLLARIVGGSVELKCGRCKQTWHIPARCERCERFGWRRRRTLTDSAPVRWRCRPLQ